MNYRRLEDNTAEIGIKICDPSFQDQGLGTASLTMFIDALFRYQGYRRVVLDTNLANTRAQYVYETKLQLNRLGVSADRWQDQLGVWQSAVEYDIFADQWLQRDPLPLPYLHLRLENEEDQRIVEELTRNAFWKNTSHEVVNEHLLVHRLRQSPSFIPELNLIAELDRTIVGHVIYSRAFIRTADGSEHPVITFGPISVDPGRQNQGIGSALMRHTIGEAKRLGYAGIVVFGHPDYYPRFGFRRGAEFGLTTAEGKTFDAFMAMELQENALQNKQGSFHEDELFANLSDEETLAFDASFPLKEALPFLLIDILLQRLSAEPRAAIAALELKSLPSMRGRSQDFIAALPGIDATTIAIIKETMAEHGFIWGKSTT